MATGDSGCEAYTAIAWGVGLSHEKSRRAGARVFIRSISEYLRRCAYRVLEAGDAEEALVIFRKPSVKVDVLFTNIEMAGSVNGFEFASGLASSGLKFR